MRIVVVSLVLFIVGGIYLYNASNPIPEFSKELMNEICNEEFV